MTVNCLRCNQKLEQYGFTGLNFVPEGAGTVVLECPKCGHLEFLSRTSPLLADLQASPTFAGDGD
jgi:hypothetical protein